MPDPQDAFESLLHDARRRTGTEGAGERSGLVGRPWLSVWFRCCSTYARIYRNEAGTMYQGCCPRCGARVRALIGEDGTERRLFETT